MSDPRPDDPLAEGPPERHLVVDGSEWIVRSGGAGAAGTGASGLAAIEAVHFYRPGEDRPRLEALLARGRWAMLFDEELQALMRTAVPCAPAEGEATGPPGSAGGRPDE